MGNNNAIVKWAKTSARKVDSIQPKGARILLGVRWEKRRQKDPRQQLSVCAVWNLNEHGWDERGKDMGQKAETPSKARGKNNPVLDSEEYVIYSLYSQEGEKSEAECCVILKGRQERHKDEKQWETST